VIGQLNCYGFLRFRLEKLRFTILEETSGSRIWNLNQPINQFINFDDWLACMVLVNQLVTFG
jgi:hypothetical protein